jgi:uncharacterized protein YdeI (BOF family)
MKKFVLLAVAILFATTPALMAEEKTWTGSLSDAKCNGKHSKDEHGATAAGDHECATKCIAGGEKNVFVSADGKTTYKIANQDFAGLKTHAGHKVALTGELKGDTITVSKIEMPAAPKSKTK